MESGAVSPRHFTSKLYIQAVICFEANMALRFQDLMVVVLKIHVFWNEVFCVIRLSALRHFRGTLCIHLQFEAV